MVEPSRSRFAGVRHPSGFEAGAAEYNFCGNTNTNPEETK
jgi:hypothetical protein